VVSDPEAARDYSTCSGYTFMDADYDVGNVLSCKSAKVIIQHSIS